MSELWVRVYTDIRSDRKIRRLEFSHRWLWIVLLTIAKESPKPGWLLYGGNVSVTFHDLADEANMSLKDVESGFSVFRDQNMIEQVDGVWRLINWDKRQFTSDLSTDRVRKHREKKRSRNVPDNKSETAVKRPQSTEYRVQRNSTDPLSEDRSTAPIQNLANLFLKATLRMDISPSDRHLMEQDIVRHGYDVCAKALNLAVKAQTEKGKFARGDPKYGPDIKSWKFVQCFLNDAKEATGGGVQPVITDEAIAESRKALDDEIMEVVRREHAAAEAKYQERVAQLGPRKSGAGSRASPS